MTNIKTIVATQGGWKVKMCFVGKAKDWIIGNEHKKRVTSAATEITQNHKLGKNNIANYNTQCHSKEVVISCL